MPSISLITIGTELLKGRIVNTNAAKAGVILQANGYGLDRVLAIADKEDAIRSSLVQELEQSDLVLVCGGLGPTKDDITKRTLADFFHTELEWHAPTLAFLEERYSSRPDALNQLTRLQAFLPRDCIVIPNTMGSAPGMCFYAGAKLVISMPGVPFEMLTMLEKGVLPIIRNAFPADLRLSRIVRLADIPESLAALRMEQIEAEFPPEISLAYLPRNDGLWLELSVHTAADQAVKGKQMVDQAQQMVFHLFEDKTYSLSDAPLPQVFGGLLRGKNLTLAVAESITGGQLAASIVSASGASDYFLGSVTAYAIKVKTDILGVSGTMIKEEGVVSESVAKAMAVGVRDLFKADVALATTGLAEPDGELKPHAYLGYADKYGAEARFVHFMYDRNVNIERATNYSLQWGLKKVRERL